ncbi:hypothetical protein [Jannaschia sp. 2305UL9-9]|uniref:hypothetical protein n=1 Tax=Jannaschia sp. 2305UL9-9 TaxID=3121638 RepID=UPI003526D5CE
MRWIFAILLCTGMASAQDLRAPTLGVASNFGQGVPRGLLEAATRAGIRDFRDAVYWADVEGADGRARFRGQTARYPDRLDQFGAGMSLTVNNGNPLYEDGATPLGADAVAAFGRHAARTVSRFPAIDGVEIGNEFNSANFVSGPLRDAGLKARADAYVALFDSVAEQVRAARPDVRIIGGGVHSIPTGYLALLGDAGLFDRMDAIALHPYDTPIDMLDRQIAVMRRLPGLETMPIELTEFGTQDAAAAPGLMLRAMCKSALSGVRRLVWYPLHPRGDGYVPLLTRDGAVTATGKTFLRLQSRLAGLPVRDLSPDRQTTACLFGDDHLVVWGAERPLRVAGEAQVTRASGQVLTAPFTLSETDPILVRKSDLDVGNDIKFGPHHVVADTFLDFTYPEDGWHETSGFDRLGRSPNGTQPLTTRPGQDRPGVPWTPYLGVASNPNLRLMSRSLLPAGTEAFAEEILHRYTADRDMVASLDLMLRPAERSLDGVSLTVTLAGDTITDRDVTGAYTQSIDDLSLRAGDVLEIAVGPGKTATGDVTAYRFTLRSAP